MDNSTYLSFQPDVFGPSRPGAFDFTLLFEDSFFTIAPASLFLIAAFARTASLYHSPAKVISTAGRHVKTAFLSAFVALNMTLLILWAIKPVVSTKASVPAACLDFVAAGALFVLSFYEHTRSVAPSTIIAIYLFVTLPLDIARVRTLFLLDDVSPTKNIAAVSATSVVVKLGILLFEAANKRHILLDSYRHLPLESTSGPYSRVLLWWINPLLRRGYRSFFQVEDLDGIDDSLSSAVLGAKFQQRWKTANKDRKFALLVTVFSVLKWSIIASGIPRMILIGLTFAQPFLITRTIDYVSDRDDQPGNIGWGLVGAYAIVYTGLALLTASSTYLMNRVTVRMRGGLVTLIYQKTVDLSLTALDESAALTLMSADVERTTHAFANFHIVWTAFIQIGIALYLLYNTLGAGFVAPGLCCLFALVAVTICTSLFPRYQGVWVGGIQSRVSSTASMLGSMRSIKFLGISAVVGDLIQGLRIRENKLAQKFRWLILFQILFQNITTVVAPVATFAVYVIQANSAGKPLDAATAFSILSILQLVEPPIMALIGSLPTLVGSIGCLARIQTFLLSPSRRDHRLSLLQSSRKDLASSGEEGIPMIEIAHKSDGSTDDLLVLNGCSFGWSSEKPLVHNIDMKVKQGSLCMIIGPTGCGKSTLIKGLLGETPSSTGFVYLGTDSIAFADQNPWSINSTIKAGVCAESSSNETFYQEVIDSCGLRDDLANMPKGDMTVVGSKGISMSGGQKARLALARAVFARKKMLILDDVFSGIDADTEEHVFRKLLSREGLLRRTDTTIILVTHAVARLSYSDWVVALNKEGVIEEQGTYDNLRRSGTYVSNLTVRYKELNAAGDEAVEERRPEANLAEVNEEEGINLLARQTGDWDTYKHYFSAAGWRQSITAAIWAFTYVAMTKAPGLVVKYFTGPGTTASSNNKFMAILGVTAAVALFALVAMVWQHFLDMIPRASNGLHHGLLTTVLGAPLSFFTKTDSGTTLNRFSQDLNTIDNELPTALITTVIQLAFFLIGGGLMAATASYALAAIPVVILVLYAVQRFYLRTSRQLRHLELEQQAPLYTHFQETLSGLPSIRAFGWVDQFCSKNFELLDRSQRPIYLLACIQCWLAVVLDLMVAALATILMVVIVSLRHKIDPGLVGLGLLNVMSFNTSLSELIKDWTLTETSIGAIARVRDFVNNTENEAKSIESVEPPAEWPSSGAIEIRDFAASYSKTSDLVLKGVSLTIRPGEKIGICGRSGSGKSSLLASLFHLLEFREGSITIDGQHTAVLPRNVLRGRLNAIPQEPYWISTKSVRFNLQPWPVTLANDGELIHVLSKCQIWDVIHEKGGLDVKMEAESLSHGQRQLFCLARSLLRKSKVVVLDEVSAR
jgi:ABC-type multidrug transport system fused ATPase/permease subunit